MSYSHQEIDSKWQKKWSEARAFQAEAISKKPKYYALDMFPYPSGSGLHVGHIASYTPLDIISRFKRTNGFNVLHPMGWDAFGLPAEQYAIQTGVHPAVTTEKSIASFKNTLQNFGFSFDWSRETSTADPKFYKWTQFIFTKLMERGLAYQKEAPVNWCPALKTVLANDEIVDGKSERGGHPVIRMPMKQWMLKITDYAERLLNDLDKLDWPERTKDGQRNWIGKSEGAHVNFKIQDLTESLSVFTTRPDTLFGVTFMVLAPENPLVQKITTPENKTAVNDYIQATSKKSEVDRKADQKKTGVPTGGFAINPLTQDKIPIWIADYVLMDYGTGAIMAVPGHDERDEEFAKKFNLPIKKVYDDQGLAIASDFLNGLDQAAATSKMIQHLVDKKLGKSEIQYKLRDWLFSRQRYWGEPFPVIKTDSGEMKTVPLEQLPVTLPEVANYEPSEKGEAPLAKATEWRKVAGGLRETDTMPGSAGSSWYFLRYIDPLNENELVGKEAEKYWMPVDIYVGGAEHTVGHLLYARFWQKVLFDCGLVTHDEPFRKLAHQGLVLGPDGEKMSKSRGNVIPADIAKAEYGADATRMYICFMGPFEKDKAWSVQGIEGVRRFLERTWRLVADDQGHMIATDEAVPADAIKVLHQTIKKVSEDIPAMSFNTSISQMMILVNKLYELKIKPKSVLMTLAQLMMPFAPHIAEEIWEKLGGKGLVSLAPWPQFDPELCKEDSVTLGVQVNGKMRGTIEITLETTEGQAVELAMKLASVTNALNGQAPSKVIYKAGKILNLIAKA
jgi:leucyl-tRNA synthetase